MNRKVCTECEQWFPEEQIKCAETTGFEYCESCLELHMGEEEAYGEACTAEEKQIKNASENTVFWNSPVMKDWEADIDWDADTVESE